MKGLEQLPILYDPIMWVAERLGLMRWRRWLAEGATGLTMEIGCGTGRNLRLYPPGARVVGVEPDRALLRVASTRAPGVPLVAARAESLPFRDGTFETVTSCLVFCTVQDPGRGLEEVRRVLGEGGSLRMVEHVRDSRRPIARLQDWIRPLWEKASGGCQVNRDTVSAVKDSGFRTREPGDAAADGENASRGTMRRFSAFPARGTGH